MGKQSWYQSDVAAANFVRAWDAITKWIYDPANKDEVLAITKKTMGGTDAGAAAGLQAARESQVGAAEPAHEREDAAAVRGQFAKAGSRTSRTDPMKYVDTSLVTKTLNVLELEV